MVIASDYVLNPEPEEARIVSWPLGIKGDRDLTRIRQERDLMHTTRAFDACQGTIMLPEHVTPVIADAELDRGFRAVQGAGQREAGITQPGTLERGPTSATRAVIGAHMDALMKQDGHALGAARVTQPSSAEELGWRIGEFAEHQGQAIGECRSCDGKGGESCARGVREDCRGVRQGECACQQQYGRCPGPLQGTRASHGSPTNRGRSRSSALPSMRAYCASPCGFVSPNWITNSVLAAVFTMTLYRGGARPNSAKGVLAYSSGLMMRCGADTCRKRRPRSRRWTISAGTGAPAVLHVPAGERVKLCW